MDELNAYFLKNLPLIEADLQLFLEKKIPNPYNELRGMMRYHMGWEGAGSGKEAQGKRLRPILALLAGENCGIPTEDMFPFSSAIELLHNFSLIHDDIEDHDERRRGRETVWKLWGIPQAINTGDLMFSLATQSMLRANGSVSETHLLAAVQAFHETCRKLTIGQYLDMKFEGMSSVSTQEYIEMITGKTATLLGFCFAIAPIAAGKSVEKIDLSRKFGETVGLAFQIQDDYLGIWGDIKVTGKASRSDLISRKKSLPILQGVENHRQFYKIWVENDMVSPELAEELAVLLEEEGVRNFVGAEVERYTEAAMQLLPQVFESGNNNAVVVKQIILQLMNRDH
jgi:geranylgeranyl diphosphate synthase type I